LAIQEVTQGRGLDLALKQQGPVVVGRYDNGEGRLQGTIEGRLLRATGLRPPALTASA
jgi:hypothetical protein